MASVQSSGVNIDVQGLVTKLVAADRATKDADISRRETALTVQLSGVSSLKGALSSFQQSLNSLKTLGTFNPRATSVSDDSYFTATASTFAAPGTYEVEVVDLASAHQLATGLLPQGANTVVGTGTLAISVGSQTFNVEIDSTNNTAGGIRDAINRATNNAGVQATLVNGVGGAKLVLTAGNTGAAGQIAINQSGGDGGLSTLQTANLTQLKPARDAHIIIAGTDITSSTNSINTAIDGITLNLKAAETTPGTTVTLTVSNDTAAVQKNIENFVTAFNQLQKTFVSLRTVDTSRGTTGAMFGDALLRSVEDQLRSALSNPVTGVTGNYTTLSSVGVTRQLDGTMALDAAKLKTALDSGNNAVANVFASDNGIAARLGKYLESQLATDASFDFRNTSIQKGLKEIAKEKEALDVRMAAVQKRYLRQFSALDSMLSSMQQTSSYLTAQLSKL